jgi:hypothetical protein
MAWTKPLDRLLEANLLLGPEIAYATVPFISALD